MYDQDKTETATPRRRRQAREKGQAARSQDLVSALVLLTAFALLLQNTNRLAMAVYRFSERLYTEGIWLENDPDAIVRFISGNAFSFILAVGSVLLLLVMVGVGSNILQTGWFFLPDRLAPDLERISPKSGLARIFSLDGAVRTGSGLVKIVLCATVVWFRLRTHTDSILRSGEYTPLEILHDTGDFLFGLAFSIGFLLLFLAVLDVLWQRWKFERDLRMTPQEIREEMKETIGDPIVIEQRRRRQQERRARG